VVTEAGTQATGRTPMEQIGNFRAIHVVRHFHLTALTQLEDQSSGATLTVTSQPRQTPHVTQLPLVTLLQLSLTTTHQPEALLAMVPEINLGVFTINFYSRSMNG